MEPGRAARAGRTIRMSSDIARGGTTLAERMATAEAQIEAIHEARADRDREIKALKEGNAEINRKLDVLIAIADPDGRVGRTVTRRD